MPAPPPAYPPTRTEAQTDTYFGVVVDDPYRWLEDDRSAETKVWVDAQNRVTRAILDAGPERARFRKRLDALLRYPRTTAPIERHGVLFYSRNDGLQNQDTVWVQPVGKAPRKLLDPNRFSADGTAALAQWTVSRDGRWLAYARSDGGSDWQTVRVVEVATGKTLPETLRWVKVSEIAWQGDGFYYSRYPTPPKGQELTAPNERHEVWFHTVGNPQSRDRRVFSDPAHPTRFHIVTTTDDERYAVLSVSDRGAGKDGNALWVLPADASKFLPLVPKITDFDYSVLGVDGDRLLVQTNDHAARGRIVAIDPKRPGVLLPCVPEQPHPLERATVAGGRIVAVYLKDVTARLRVFGLDGKRERDIPLPGPGSITGLTGRTENATAYVTFASYSVPATVYSLRLADGRLKPWKSPKIPGYDPAQFLVEQVFYKSADGTPIPLFLTYKKGTPRDGARPTILYGYGGFKASLTPAFDSTLVAWLERGGVYAVASLRGGNEYGEAWHRAGMRLKKQTVFDDFLAAADYLVAQRWASRATLALKGESNGGLLVGAVINQRPDVCAAAIAGAGVMDMLRFHKFTIGWNWIPEYGSSAASEADFQNLYRISPVHNVPRGPLPAILVTTADHDDRVVPGHSFKYAAALQAAQTADRPVVIRVETNSGHGASSLGKYLDLQADILSFLWTRVGVGT